MIQQIPFISKSLSACAIAITLLVLPLLGEAGTTAEFRAESWTTDQGLPDDAIKALCQTRDGYLWFTTDGGIVRFDGVKFRVFNTDNTPQLLSDRYASYALLEDRQGALWAATLRHGVVRYYNGVFTSYTTQSGLPHNIVHRIDEDADGRIWFFTSGGLARWDSGVITAVPTPAPGNNSTLTPRTVLTPILGEGWVHFGLWQLDPDGLKRFAHGKWTVVPVPNFSAATLRLTFLQVDSRRKLWFSLKDRPRHAYSVGDRGELETYENLIPGSPFSICYRDGSGRLIVRAIDGRIGFGSNQGFTPIPGITAVNDSQVLEDRQGHLWIGTQNQGLIRVKQSALKLHSDSGLPEFSAGRVLIPGQEGVRWFGTEGGLVRFDGAKMRSYSIDNVPGYELPRIARALHEDPDGTLWIGGMAGIVRMRNGSIQSDPDISPRIRGGVNAIHRDRKGNLWIGSVAGLWRVPAGMPNRAIERTSFPGPSVASILEDKKGVLWFGTNIGLARYDGSRFESFSTAEGMVEGRVVSLLEDSAGMLWAGTTEKGIVRVTPTSTGVRFTQFTTKSGLFDNAAYQMLEDQAGYFWIASRLGLYRVRRQHLDEIASGARRLAASTHYGPEDMPRLNFAVPRGSPGAFRAPDGKLWFATLGGIAELDPRMLRESTAPPPARIEDCLVNGLPVSCRTPLQLGPASPDVEIHYSGLSFIRSSQIRFRYRLEGLDRNWIDVANRRTAYYQQLPPGDYRFRLQAANSDGVWGEESTPLRITVAPPFYRTWWFLVLTAAATIALAAYVHRRRMSSLLEANAAQERYARQLIELQENERKRIAAELHDSLGQNLLLIKNRAILGLLSQDMEPTARTHLEEIASSASQSIQEVRQIAFDLRPQHLDRLGLTQALEAMIERAAEASPIRFTARFDNIDGCFPKTAEITVYRIVQECVSNILKHSYANTAELQIERYPASVQLTISDDGNGFTPSQLQANPTGGFGLFGIAERVRILDGQYAIDSQPGKGATIRVQLPAIQSIPNEP